eukprot:jgi/Psemu1/328188/estExt_fgenesh1_pg.C_10640003
MVFSVLFEQLLPSHRGLKRNHKRLRDASSGNDGRVWEQQEELQQQDRIRHKRWLWMRQKSQSQSLRSVHYKSNRSNNLQNSLLDLEASKDGSSSGDDETTIATSTSTADNPYSSFRSSPGAKAVTRPKRKRCKASKCLASLAADFDVVTDWLFYFHCVGENREDPRIPKWIMAMVLASCVLGTLSWLVLATDGALATPLLRSLGYDKLSLGHVLFVSVLVEDIPQVLLTFIIEECYPGEAEAGSAAVTQYALISVVASLYDTLIKIAEAFDERTDVVETGRWCKDSIRVHPRGKPLACIAPLPVLDDQKAGERDHDLEHGRSLLEEATTIVAETKLPRIRFLSVTKDGSVQLWDTRSNPPGRQEDVASLDFESPTPSSSSSSSSVSCLVLLPQPPAATTDPSENCFLTGHADGTVRLWTTNRRACLKSYSASETVADADEERIAITSLAVLLPGGGGRDDSDEEHDDDVDDEPESQFPACLPREYRGYRFVTGHESGRARVWNLGSGSCLLVCDPGRSVPPMGRRNSKSSKRHPNRHRNRLVRTAVAVLGGHSRPTTTQIHAVCSLDDGTSGFATATNTIAAVPVSANPRTVCSGHDGAVLAVGCLSPGRVLVSGSEDATARLWSVATGACLRVFDHNNPNHHRASSVAVTALEVVDPWTVLTGSRDGTLRVWDALSKSCIRTYDGEHSGAITSVHHSSGAFCSAGEDGTAKLWVFSAIPNDTAKREEETPSSSSRSSEEEEEEDDDDDDEYDGTLRDLLGVQDGSLTCMACQAESGDDLDLDLDLEPGGDDMLPVMEEEYHAMED